MLIVYLPSLLVGPPTEVPLNLTDTNGSGSLVLPSVTRPVTTVVCANSEEARKRKKLDNRSLLYKYVKFI